MPHSRMTPRARVVCALLLLLAGAWTGQDLAGHYRLEGVHEMAAELVLGRDGRFTFALAYGALDQEAHGSWSRRGDGVVLVADRPPPPSFGGATLSPRPEPALERLGKSAPLVVRVATPGYGVVWRNVEVVIELSDGRTRTGVTARDGRAEFSPAEWKGAYPRRFGVAYPERSVPRRWYPVPDPTIRTVNVDFIPGNIIKPAFQTRTVRVTARDGRPALLMEGVPGAFVR